MNTIDFNKYGECVIKVGNAVSTMTFLGNGIFNNSVPALKKDIDECENDTQRKVLQQFLDECTIHNIFDDVRVSEEETLQNQNLVIGRDDDYQVVARVYNLEPIHSGFWYAAFNIRKELENQKLRKHIDEGFARFCDSVDAIIEIIRKSDSEECALNEIIQMGYTEPQARAILVFPLNSLGTLEKESLVSRISKCEQIISFLEKVMIKNRY